MKYRVRSLKSGQWVAERRRCWSAWWVPVGPRFPTSFVGPLSYRSKAEAVAAIRRDKEKRKKEREFVEEVEYFFVDIESEY